MHYILLSNRTYQLGTGTALSFEHLPYSLYTIGSHTLADKYFIKYEL
jgi:hypothetical protein